MHKLTLNDGATALPTDIYQKLLEECQEMVYKLPINGKSPSEAKDMRFYVISEAHGEDEFTLLSATMSWLNLSPAPHMGGIWSGKSFYSELDRTYYVLAMLWW